jgi:hypothetical protein
MGELYDQICSWDNLRLAHQNAARCKRGKHAAAAFEYNLADHLLELQSELISQTYQPGPYHSFYVHDPKHRLISAAPFRDRVAIAYGNRHALCNVTAPILEQSFIFDSRRRRPTAWARARTARWIGHRRLRGAFPTCCNAMWSNFSPRLITGLCGGCWRARFTTGRRCG